jgi:hypothetical protein
MEYRTEKQYWEILDNTVNGNWTKAFILCEKYGFYAEDLIQYYNDDFSFFKESKLAILAEGAMRIRMENALCHSNDLIEKLRNELKEK